MTGKIFNDSTCVLEDEARVLFDYYKKAAQKIVSEEVALEEKIEDAKSRQYREGERKRKFKILLIVFAILSALGAGSTVFLILKVSVKMGVLFAVASAAFLVTMITAIVKMLDAKRAVKTYSDNIAAYESAKADIRRDYAIEKMAVVYVPLASRVPFRDKSFVVDHTGREPNSDFSLTVLHKADEFQDTLRALESSIKEVPIAEGNKSAESIDTSSYSKSVQNVVLHDYMGALDRQVRNISYLLGDNDELKVSLPVVTPNGEYDKFLSDFCTTDTAGGLVVKVFDTDAFNDRFKAFEKLSDMNKALERLGNSDNITYMKELMKRLAQSVDTVSAMKVSATSKLLNYTNMIFSNVLKAANNEYSPTLEAQEIERVREATFDFQDSVEDYTPFNMKSSSRVKYDLLSGAWVAEDGSRTSMPFGVNQIQEEVLMPLINNLMEQTRIERLKIYNSIKDQKMHYLNEWNKDVEAAFRDNRKAARDLIAQLTKAYSEYNSAYQTYMSYKSTQDAMKKSHSLEDGVVEERDNSTEQVAGFEAQAAQCNAASEDFQNYMDRLQEDIEEKSARFEHIDYYEAVLRDTNARDTARSLDPKTLQSLSDRQKRLINVSTYSAVYSKLPPEPSIEDKLQEDFTQKMTSVADELLKNDGTEGSGD